MSGMRPEVLVLGSFPAWYIKRLGKGLRVHEYNRTPNKDSLLAELAPRLEILVADGAVNGKTILALPKLKAIVSMAAGYEAIDFAAARAHGIQVSYVPGVNDECVADMAWALLLACGRHILRGDRHVRTGAWMKGLYPLVPRVNRKRLGILGLGRIGLAIAKRGEAFGMTISYHNRSERSDVPYRYHADLAELAADSDFLVVAAPGGPVTRHLVDAAVLKALGPGGTLVNVGRGSIIDQVAMVRALKDNSLGWAGLDVFENEPSLLPELAALENVVLMPHRGGSTVETYEATCDLARDNIFTFLRTGRVSTPVPGSA